MPIEQTDKILFQLAQARRTGGMAQRHGFVSEIKESGGERKVRLVLGFNKNGEPWMSPWVNTEEHRGGSSSQQLVEVGQSMVYTGHGGADFRNGTASPSSESQSNPQPPHAPQFNGDTTSNGSKVRTATNKSSGGGGGTSLLGTTEVLTADGFKSIQDIKLGDKILSCPTNAVGRKPVEDTVIGIHAALVKKPVFTLTYEGGSVCCTGDHEIWTETRNQYVASDRLGFLDKVRSFDSVVAITSLVPQELQENKVYDLTVEKHKNFYVRDGSSGSPILVHNQGGGGGGGSDTHSIWIDNQAEQRQQHAQQTGQYGQAGGGGGSQSGQGQGGGGQSNKPDPMVISHLNEDGTWTARHKKDCRVMTAEKGSKIKTTKSWAIVTKEGKHIVKKPWIIGKDPIDDNDSV